MNTNNLMIFILAMALAFASCAHSHEELEENAEHEEAKVQYTSYNHDFELYAEADPFIVGDTANVLSHFSILPDFKPVREGEIKMELNVNGSIISQIVDRPARTGIYNFRIKPETAGKGTLKFEITGKDGKSELEIADVYIHQNHEEAHAAAEHAETPEINTTVFTKEQSWKIDFATEYPVKGPFGQVIKTPALLKPSPDGEMVITAKTNGMVSFSNSNMLEGKEISTRQVLFTISGSELAENNFTVRYGEAKNNFEKARADYERATELARDKIVSEKDLLNARIQYENSKNIFDNLNKNFSASGQNVTSPMNGFVRQVFVRNGSYVEAGQPVLTISQDKKLILTADIQQKYAHLLGSIKSADIRTLHDDHYYALEQLNGRILSYGKSANAGNYLIPVTLQIENNGKFTTGTFVEVYLKTVTSLEAITVPNSALIEEQSNYFVYTQVTPELFEKREVTTGTTDGFRTEILSGISDDERIVTKGAIFIKLSQSTGTLDAHSGHVH